MKERCGSSLPQSLMFPPANVSTQMSQMFICWTGRNGMALTGSFKHFKCFLVCFSSQYCGSLNSFQLLCPQAEFSPWQKKRKQQQKKTEIRTEDFFFLLGLFIVSVCVWGGVVGGTSLIHYTEIILFYLCGFGQPDRRAEGVFMD